MTCLKNHVQSDSPYIDTAATSFRPDLLLGDATGESRLPRFSGG